jgi:hypothetical protein
VASPRPLSCGLAGHELHLHGPHRLYLIWGSADAFGLAGLWLAAGLAASAYIGFYAAAIAKPIYGGAQYDQNGVLPVHVPIGGKRLAFDVNMAVFTLKSLLLVVAVICLMRADAI